MKDILEYLNKLSDVQLVILSIMLMAIFNERKNKGADHVKNN